MIGMIQLKQIGKRIKKLHDGQKDSRKTNREFKTYLIELEFII
jgi:hypothetical protein